ncbi:hypothetical protein [Weissella cibaria]|uniref:hypothetical protein n=1 Tax=Weissella cibaria TaxID=137591 RepID=UPI00143F39BF|nr:hypothetical protein [Weissella cibaria]NKN29564.1 hypothetical protein [Weissella cibaria]NKN78462.1 hypothetical protein [Weissella cibaria]NKN96383.1 hypothetical protein [Weissella cibaria]NKN98739.1 hypothetical protein [Weissella cibaria]
MGITIQIDDAAVTKIAGAIRTNIPRVARTNEAMILANPKLSERLPKLAALADDELVRGYLQVFLMSANDTNLLLDKAWIDQFLTMQLATVVG